MAKCVHCGGTLKSNSHVCPWCDKAVGNKNERLHNNKIA